MAESATTWIVTDGKTGMVSQAMGLAEAVGFDVVTKTIRPAAPWRWIPAALWPPVASGVGNSGDSLQGTPPDLLISCGRHAVGPALWLRRRHGDRPFLVHVQHPHVNPARFDLIVAPMHDGLSGPNVVRIIGAPHGVTKAKLEAAAQRFAMVYRHVARPLVAVLVGGSNSVYRMTDAVIDRLIGGLKQLVDSEGAGLLVTLSRRTDATVERRLRDALGPAAGEIWSGQGENPYLGYLALADAIVVTGDSVNMISEACSTGKPVFIAELAGDSRNKFADFHTSLFSAGITRRFEGRLERWSYPPLDGTARAAAEVRRRMGFQA